MFAPPLGFMRNPLSKSLATDEWLLNGDGSNSVGTETMVNVGTGSFQPSFWQALLFSDYLHSDGIVAGNSNNQSLAFKSNFKPVGVLNGSRILFGKEDLSGGGVGWDLRVLTATSLRFFLDDGPVQIVLDITTPTISDGNVHQISGLYNFDTNMMYLKTNTDAEVSRSTATITNPLDNAAALCINTKGYLTGAPPPGTPSEHYYFGVCVGTGAQAQAYYDSVVAIP